MFEELGRALDNLIRGIAGGASTRIDVRTDPISIDYPEGTPAQLRLEVGVGQLNVTPGGDNLVDGTATYNVEEWQPTTTVEGSKVILRQGTGWSVPPFWGDLKNDWDLRLGTARPFELSVAKGVATLDLALGGIPLTGAVIETGAGKATIRFDKPNPQNAVRVEIKSGVGETAVSGLLNTNAPQINVQGGMGETRLGFTGEALQQDMNANVGLGVGEAKIDIKAGTPTRVTLSQGLGSINVLGDFQQVGEHTYETRDFNSVSGPKLTLKIASGLGAVTVATV